MISLMQIYRFILEKAEGLRDFYRGLEVINKLVPPQSEVQVASGVQPYSFEWREPNITLLLDNLIVFAEIWLSVS